MNKILIYGAYGYTGTLTAELAAQKNLPVILSGRNETKVRTLAGRLKLPWNVASLDDPDSLDAAMADCSIVLHCAGPYVRTYRQMAEACLRNKVHYLDITGEIEVFEGLAAMDTQAKTEGVMLMPGVGFDVVPTDCTAARLKELLPDATHLDLAFKTIGGQLSHGTASTMIMGLGQPNLQRINGKITPVPIGKHSIQADFGRGATVVSGIPWGDVSTAFYTTGIPNIATYISLPASSRRAMKAARFIGSVLRSNFVQKRAQARVDKAPAGPSASQRAESFTLVWGRARNAAGETKAIRLKTLNGYDLTAKASLYIAKQVLNGAAEPGFKTPAGHFGAELLSWVDPGASFQNCD